MTDTDRQARRGAAIGSRGRNFPREPVALPCGRRAQRTGCREVQAGHPLGDGLRRKWREVFAFALIFAEMTAWLEPDRGGRAFRMKDRMKCRSESKKGELMSFWALVFLLMAAVSAAFGFGDIVPVSAGDAQALFFLFIALFVVSLVAIVVGKTTLR